MNVKFLSVIKVMTLGTEINKKMNRFISRRLDSSLLFFRFFVISPKDVQRIKNKIPR